MPETPALLPPTREDIERLAGEAFLTIPAALRRHVANIVFCVEDFPDEDVEREMELETPFDILGLYRGAAERCRGRGPGCRRAFRAPSPARHLHRENPRRRRRYW